MRFADQEHQPRQAAYISVSVSLCEHETLFALIAKEGKLEFLKHTIATLLKLWKIYKTELNWDNPDRYVCQQPHFISDRCTKDIIKHFAT